MQCEYRHLWDHGTERQCGQTVGLRRWYDAAGTLHAACRTHWSVIEYRYPAADPPEPEWLPESADPMTMAKAEADRWTVTDPRDTPTWTAA